MSCGCSKCKQVKSSCGGSLQGGVNELNSGSCGQATSTCDECCTGNSNPGHPVPFYEQTPVCQEGNYQVINNRLFYTELKTEASFNVPECGENATLTIPGLVAALEGTYIWNPTYGYFEIVSFDLVNSQIEIRNNCQTGNADPGTRVPSCTGFIITDLPATSNNGPSNLFPYVAIDFTAPADGDCIDITVTNVNGLQTGKNVNISSGTYLLQAILSATLITICNEGDGITPGTSVIAENAAGELQYPVSIIDANACDADPVAAGAILVCHNGSTTPLSAPIEGQVPASTGTDNEVEMRTLDVPFRACTFITCCLTIVDGVGDYIITVGDSGFFVEGDVLQIGDRTDRFVITSIIDDTHIEGLFEDIPSETVTIADGTPICVITCCEDLQNQIDGMLTTEYAEDTGTDTVNLDKTTNTFTGATGTATFINPSSTQDMKVLYGIHASVIGTAVNAKANNCDVEVNLHQTQGANPPQVVVVDKKNLYVFADTAKSWNFHEQWVDAITVPAGTTVVVTFNIVINFTDHASNAGYNVSAMVAFLEGIGVLV